MKKIKPVLWNICFFFIILTPNVAYFLFGKNVDAANYENGGKTCDFSRKL